MRSKNAGDRRAVLEVLNVLRKSNQWIANRWTVRTMLYDSAAPRDEHGNIVQRERREDEYPENSAREWAVLVKTIDDQIGGLRQLREFAAANEERARIRKSQG